MRFDAVLAVGIAVCVLAAEPLAWKEYISKDGHYTILLPGVPKERSVKVGTATLSIAEVQAAKSELYSVMFNDLPHDAKLISKPEVVEKILDSVTKDAVANVKGKELSVKKITLGDHAGREVAFQISDERYYRARIFVAHCRLYQVVIDAPKDVVQSREAETFLDSFNLTK